MEIFVRRATCCIVSMHQSDEREKLTCFQENPTNYIGAVLKVMVYFSLVLDLGLV